MRCWGESYWIRGKKLGVLEEGRVGEMFGIFFSSSVSFLNHGLFGAYCWVISIGLVCYCAYFP